MSTETKYEIREIEEVVKKTKYVVFVDGSQSFPRHDDREGAELHIELMKCAAKHRVLPFHAGYYYCSMKEQLLNYAKLVGYQHLCGGFMGTPRHPDTYFVSILDIVWTGPDWYKFEIEEDDGEHIHHYDSLQRQKDAYAKKMKEFEDAVMHPKTFYETMSPRDDQYDGLNEVKDLN